MDKLKFKIFYDDEYHRPHVAIKINGKDLTGIIIKECDKMIPQKIVPFEFFTTVSWQRCLRIWPPRNPDIFSLAGRYVYYFLDEILTSKNPYVLSDDDWVIEYYSSRGYADRRGIVEVTIRETDNSVIWENVRISELNFFSFEFDKEQYYQEIFKLIDIYGLIIPEELFNKMPQYIVSRLEKPLHPYSMCEYFLLWYGKSYYFWDYFNDFYIEGYHSKINNEWIDEQCHVEKFLPRQKNDRKRMRF